MKILVRGSGPPLVMLHGWAMHGGIFAPLAARLERHFQLHLVDLPGHGRSGDSALASSSCSSNSSPVAGADADISASPSASASSQQDHGPGA